MTQDWSDWRTLPWLTRAPEWPSRVKALKSEVLQWDECVALANSRMDFIECDRLDRLFRKLEEPQLAGKTRIKVAILSSCTTSHLHAGIRVAGLRRGMWIDTYECAWGQYQQELLDESSGLHSFRPDVVLLSIDARTLAAAAFDVASEASAHSAASRVVEGLQGLWIRAREVFGCHVLQQAALPVFEPLIGENEHRLPGSRVALIERLNGLLRAEVGEAGVDLVSLDNAAHRDGIDAWHSVALWHKAKQEVAHTAAPLYGDLVMRVVAARRGRSFKCLVMDLDNTLWGGVVGDDGLTGIVLGQGSAGGEAFVAVQQYAKHLAERGIILAVCSKNDEKVAMEAFEKHPEMTLKASDISCFVANWNDKAMNIRAIAQRLNIGLDSVVFLDDNPFERNLVRAELPMVAVPELPDDPALYPRAIAAAGYFEACSVTTEDRARTSLYSSNAERQALAAQATDLPGYLRSLEMNLFWGRFDEVNRQRIVQLINKTNQFNLTTRRYTDDDYSDVMNDGDAFGLHFRLTDRFGDNGIISVVIGRKVDGATVLVDTWLMSCRVLGREVEQAVLGIVAARARELGAERLIGEYKPTARNEMVARHYERLGFRLLVREPDGSSRAERVLRDFEPPLTSVNIAEA
jgi:FkbH-like protein